MKLISDRPANQPYPIAEPPSKLVSRPVKHGCYPWWKFRDHRPVTIALGILSDGVVLVADSEIGVDYLKTNAGKIGWVGRTSARPAENSAIAVTGSGNVAYLQHIQRDFQKYIAPGEKAPSTAEFGVIAQQYVDQFYGKHILPFAAYGNERPNVDLVLACSDSDDSALWSTSLNVVTRQEAYAAVGVGEMYARILFNQLFIGLWPLRMKTAILLA